MSPADVEQVMEIERGSYPTAWTSDDFDRHLASPRHRYWVAECDDRIVGYTGLELDGLRAHVTTVTVASQYRKQGIGMQLMDALTAEAGQRGVTEVRLEVGIRNRDARRLYRRFGFATIGVRRGYYPGEDALIMRARGVRWLTNPRLP
jgi:[ribosomal protein S18]-alanine N-acetyltransferase